MSGEKRGYLMEIWLIVLLSVIGGNSLLIHSCLWRHRLFYKENVL